MPISRKVFRIRCLCVLLSAGIISLSGLPFFSEGEDLENAYWNAEFSRIVAYFEAKGRQDLSLENKLLYIECLIRNGQGAALEPQIRHLLTDFPQSGEVKAVAGIWHFSQGRIADAEASIRLALEMNPNSPKATLARARGLLHLRQFQEAGRAFEVVLERNREWAASQFLYLLGLDVYRAARDFQKLSMLYRNRSEGGEDFRDDREHEKDLKANFDLYRRLGNKSVFETFAKSSYVSIPFEPASREDRPNTISLILKNKTYRVLLDTGNSAGWVVHNRELADLLKLRRGGRVVTKIGTEMGLMEGYHATTRSVAFDGFDLKNAVGLFIAKPRPDFYDANLNPAFIRDRVVTLDFIHKRMILRTKPRFDEDMKAQVGKDSEKLPWYGYRYVFTPLEIEGREALAVVETGASDFSLDRDFAERLGLELKAKSRFLADGKEYAYHETEIRATIGQYLFFRKDAEVWPLERFTNRLSGLSADIVLGPGAFADSFVLTFDPFDNKIVLSQQ